MAATQLCPFCSVINGSDVRIRVLYRDDRITAFLPLRPATRGHVLIVPHRHVSDVRQLERHEAHDLADAVRRLAVTIWTGLDPPGLNIIQSNGAAASQTVDHLHVHLVPRWPDDHMGLRWPDDAAENGPEQDQTLALLRAVLLNSETAVSPEDRRQHLAFIQASITRMSEASSSAKTWLLPPLTLAYGYAATNDAATVALLGAGATIIFGLLDANYLKQERAFRTLYDDVARGNAIPAFALNPALAASSSPERNYWPDWQDLWSWTVAPVYLPLLLTGVAIFIALQW